MNWKYVLPALVLSGAICHTISGQAISSNGGSIQGTVTDPSGAALPNVTISITDTDNGFTKSLVSDSAGFYSVGPLNPGNYTIMFNAAGFKGLAVKTIVQTGTVTPGTYKLTLGESNQTVEVTTGAVQVNTEQFSVSDVITKQQIDSLPINGRNFLDLAQIEPGVILQSGESFDPTKAGYSAISVGGVGGRSTRILLDGQDITDEFVGTTIFNVSQGAINEFQLNRANQDVSGDVTSTGQVLVSTNSGTNGFHGQLFYNFQDQRALTANTAAGNHNPFQRNQFGLSFGGPLIKDKLFFFGNSERIKQDQSSSITLGSLFPQIQSKFSSLPSPYRETYSTIRLDYNGPFTGHYFVRGNYNVNSSVSNFGSGYELYANRDNTPGIAGGADFQKGKFTHSFRGSYEKFHNRIADNTAGNSSVYNGIPGLNFRYAAQNLFSGPNVDAPQGTFQSDKQVRYDGSWTKGQHNVRYGYSFNRIQSAAFANFFALAPRATLSASTKLAQCGDPTVVGPCLNNPTQGYNTSGVRFGNGLGFSTELPGFGLGGGGLASTRMGAYIGDSWKISPNFTLSGGVRWSLDTNRANQDAPVPLCSDIPAGTVATALLPCTGNTPLLSAFGPGLGGKVNTPYHNFSPQLGFAYSPGDHKTVLRGGVGIFFESDVFNNSSNARTPLLKSGLFIDYSHIVCGGKTTFTLPNGSIITGVATGSGPAVPFTTICSLSLQNAAPYFLALNQQYQAATIAAGPSTNSAFIGNTLYTAASPYAANYKTPYSEQFTGGVQRELFKGGVLSVDYVHNSTLRIGQTVDANHVGAARTLNTTAANAAVAATLLSCGATTINGALVSCPKFKGARAATINDFAANNLDSGNAANGGQPAGTQGQTPTAGGPAFPGVNPLLGLGSFIEPIGRSGYDALEIVFREQKAHPAPGIMTSNFQVSYTLSRIVSTSSGGADQFFTSASYDNDQPATRYIGQTGLDHTHEISFGGSFRPKYAPQVGIIGHYYSPPAANLNLDTGGSTTAQIFQTDVTGDGTIGDLVPGTNPGSYGRSYKGGDINKLINQYNNTAANQFTPAGLALINAGIFTSAQLRALGGVTPIIASAPSNPIQNQSFKTVDVNFSYPIVLSRFREGLSIEPAIAFYNVGNFSNFLPFGGAVLNGGAGSFNGPNDSATYEGQRVQRGSGTSDVGGSRSTEFQLKLNF